LRREIGEVRLKDLLPNTWTGRGDEVTYRRTEMPEETIPPTESRRRGTDRVSPKRVGYGLLFAFLPMVGGVNGVLEYHERWVKVEMGIAKQKVLEQRIEQLEARSASLESLLEDADDRTGRLERYQCRLGWNPPTTRNIDRDCGRRDD
jgi:hypothetical protein